ncbi:smoothelin isoform X2 [Clupea harengus]|uniref:Smoothelin isoform X2 n=1 Tax=Clupea harengus TaxID=7950 RepID=A0A8M1KNU6_CLUHA|nr:smoothelin isoform X2 [Clupea harengus]
MTDTMTDINYSTLDEPALRNLLEGTVDMEQRRTIRSAIRELRRREIEDMEAALRSKRFRHAPHHHDDKENQHRSELAESLNVLSGKLQSINDIEELTRMLRGALNYEERKLIRAAIRREREQEIQGATAKITGHPGEQRPSQSSEQFRPSAEEVRESTEEREPIKAQLNSQPHPQDQEQHPPGSASGMVLVLDPQVRGKVSAPPGSPTSDPEVIPSCPRQRCDSSQSDRSGGGGGFGRRQSQDSHCSERSVSSQDRPQHRSPSPSGSDLEVEQEKEPALQPSTDAPDGATLQPSTDAPDGATLQPSTNAPDGATLQPSIDGATLQPSTDTSDGATLQPSIDGATLQPSIDAPDGAALSRKAMSSSGLPNGLRDGSTPQVCVARDAPLTTLNNGKETGSSRVAAPLGRLNSVRDRMRKFTEPAHAETPPLRRGLQRSVRPLSSHLGEKAGRPVPQVQKSPSPAGPPPEAPGQSQRAVGGAGVPAGGVDAGGRAEERSPEPEHPERGRAERESPREGPGPESHAEPAETQRHTDDSQDHADDDMKTFLTIEIKDGRNTQLSQQPQARTITHTSTGPQRAELTLGLRATPFKMSTASISTGPSFKVESESAMFAVEPSVHNGSSAKPLTSDQSRGASTAARSQEHTIRVASDQSRGASTAAQAQEHTIRVASDQSRAAPAPARAQEHTIRVMTEQSHVSAAQVKAQGSSGRVTAEQLDAIEDEELLDKMLDESKDFEERKLIRAAMRDLRKKKREIRLGCTQEEIDLREKERDLRLEAVKKQREERQKGKAGEMVTKKVEKSADGSTLSQVTKTNRFTHSDDGSRSSRSSTVESSYVQKTDKGTVQSKSYSFSSSSSSSSGKKVGSVFDREDDSAQERRQLEKKKELMRAQTMPKSTANQARKVMMEKLDAGGVGNPAVARVNKVQRSASFGVPNANSIKQMLLDWCRAKTRSYQNVEIKNFSTSWCNGMAFCALVHNFFPQAFDYDSLSPTNRRQNFQLAFDTAEELADVPCLLDVEDMVGMREPDWKCVYTYLQEFYRGLVLKGLVKTKGSA